MKNKQKRKKELTPQQQELIITKDYFDRIAPGVVKIFTDHYICGNFYKSCWAVTEYPPTTEETAILAHLADRNGVTLRIYNRLVNSMEQRKIVQQAMRKNHMMTTTNDVSESVKAQDNINDVVELLSELRRNKEPLLHTAVFIELRATTEDKLRELQADIQMELTRSKISVDRLLLRQKEGFLAVLPCGNNVFGLNSMCKGAEAKYFDGHTNIRDAEFICFGVKGLMDTNKRLKDTLLFNILSYMSNQLLGKGNTVATVDELYLFLTNMTAIEYIRNGMKRVRKKESSFILASQNIEDFLLPEIKEFTKPLFSIPSHHFLFNAGQINPQEYMDALQLEESEFSLIRYPERGTCLYRCGNERYLLQVIAPAYKAALFGAAGGR